MTYQRVQHVLIGEGVSVIVFLHSKADLDAISGSQRFVVEDEEAIEHYYVIAENIVYEYPAPEEADDEEVADVEQQDEEKRAAQQRRKDAIEWLTAVSEEGAARDLEAYVRKQTPTIPAEGSLAYDALAYDAFWDEKGLPRVNSYGSFDMGLPRQVAEKQRRIEDATRQMFEKEVQEREATLIPKWTDEFVEWARGKHFDTVIQADADQFFRDNNLTLRTDVSARALRAVLNGAKVALKEEKARKKTPRRS
jgi:hypothetical protein